MIRPRWRLLIVEIIGLLAEEMVWGPTFSSQFWSTFWVANFWPAKRDIWGMPRWTIIPKNTSMAESRSKYWLGIRFTCLAAFTASSTTMAKPTMVTKMARPFR